MPYVQGFLRVTEPGRPDNSLPGAPTYPDQGLPGEPPYPDQGLPSPPPGVWPPPVPSHPIVPAPPGTPPGTIWPSPGHPTHPIAPGSPAHPDKAYRRPRRACRRIRSRPHRNGFGSSPASPAMARAISASTQAYRRVMTCPDSRHTPIRGFHHRPGIPRTGRQGRAASIPQGSQPRRNRILSRPAAAAN